MFSLEALWIILSTKLPVFMEGVVVTIQLAAWTVVGGSLLGIWWRCCA